MRNMTKMLSETKTSLRVTAPDIECGPHNGTRTDDDGAGNLDQLIEELNNSVRPPQELVANDVVIRTMYLVSGQVSRKLQDQSSRHSRFRRLRIVSDMYFWT